MYGADCQIVFGGPLIESVWNCTLRSTGGVAYESPDDPRRFLCLCGYRFLAVHLDGDLWKRRRWRRQELFGLLAHDRLAEQRALVERHRVQREQRHAAVPYWLIARRPQELLRSRFARRRRDRHWHRLDRLSITRPRVLVARLWFVRVKRAACVSSMMPFRHAAPVRTRRVIRSPPHTSSACDFVRDSVRVPRE